MYYLSSRIRNFKRIQDTTVKLSGRLRIGELAFAGLNERGKTTILKFIHNFSPNYAMNQFVGREGGFSVQFKGGLSKHSISSFAGDVPVAATIRLERNAVIDILQSSCAILPDSKGEYCLSKIVGNDRKVILKRKVRRQLNSLGFKRTKEGCLRIEGCGKDVIRNFHRVQRKERLESSRDFFDKKAIALIGNFASGKEVNPENISPKLKRVYPGTPEGELFRFASLTWSVPVSKGFGRRLRYIVRDEQNGKLIGLIALGDPVFNLSARDKLIGWSADEKANRLVNIMDAYVLGALPPYNFLLGGKLIASLLRTRNLYNDFKKVYGETTGIISKKKKKARLLAITTSSSMGRSSVYNRVKLDGIQYLESIGYTNGWGHFHISDKLFSELREYLRHIGHNYTDHYRYGNGPNWRLRATRSALTEIGIKVDDLRHTIQREVFICKLATNAETILRNGGGRPKLASLLSAKEVAQLAIKRWMIPRSIHRPEYKEWNAHDLFDLFGAQGRKIQTKLNRFTGA